MADAHDTTDVDARYRDTVSIHGREFQLYAIEHAVQFLPIDEDEINRLEAQHRVFAIVFDDKLIFPPLTEVGSILDLGYGEASWAVSVAETFVNSEVIGVDISLHMKPDDIPENFWPQSRRGEHYSRASVERGVGRRKQSKPRTDTLWGNPALKRLRNLSETRQFCLGFSYGCQITEQSLWRLYKPEILLLDDLNEPFTFPSNHFDLVHSRLVTGGINRARWPTYMRDIKRVLKPGGWVQIIDYYFMCQSDNGSLTDASALRQWSTKYICALDVTKNPRIPLQLQNMCNAAGLVNVEFRMIPIPLCGWSDDPRMRRIGEANKVVVQETLSTLALLPFTRLLGMDIEQVNDLITRAQAEAVNPSLRAYFPLYVCIGMKPRT